MKRSSIKCVLPDTAASTLLRLLKPCLTQIFPHRDVDMWGRVWMSRFRGAWQSLNFDIEYIFGSPPWELELRPLGVATGNALSVTRVWRYICKNTTCWPATAHDVTTGVPQYKCRRENTSSAFSSSLTGLFEACNLVRVQFSLYQMASTSKAFKIVWRCDLSDIIRFSG